MSEKITKIAIGGCLGRMGQRLCYLAIRDKTIKLVGCLQYENHEFINKTLHSCMPDIFTRSNNDSYVDENAKNLRIISNLYDLKDKVDVLIDFSKPKGSVKYAQDAKEIGGINLVIGTTGMTDQEVNITTGDEIRKKLAIVYSMNFSLGINLMSKLAAQTSKVLGDEYDIEIMEIHHNKKEDAPSGTAYALADSICQATGRNVREDLLYGRNCKNIKRTKNEICMHSLRMGGVVGEHTVYFSNNFERIEITHKAQNRDLFAHGALRAAKWVSSKKEGLFTMHDVLNI